MMELRAEEAEEYDSWMERVISGQSFIEAASIRRVRKAENLRSVANLIVSTM